MSTCLIRPNRSTCSGRLLVCPFFKQAYLKSSYYQQTFAGNFVGSDNTFYHMGVPGLQGNDKFWCRSPSQKHAECSQPASFCCHLAATNEESNFVFLPNYFFLFSSMHAWTLRKSNNKMALCKTKLFERPQVDCVCFFCQGALVPLFVCFSVYEAVPIFLLLLNVFR